MADPSLTAWRLVQQSAEELTEQGAVPFTRGDLIRCVRHEDPRYGANTINPVIQGLTDNLRGGAPGADGGNLLHHVGRGRFELAEGGSVAGPSGPHDACDPRPDDPEPSQGISRKSPTPSANGEPSPLGIGGYEFAYVCTLVPERRRDGAPLELFPHERYANNRGLCLHRYGGGPFCAFAIPSDLERPGVYAVVEDGEIRYIGECEDLSHHFNMGYGQIAPRNCFRGGQETNCRINALVLDATTRSARICLWFLETTAHKAIEAELRNRLHPPWNRV